jgi:predicted kinase
MSATTTLRVRPDTRDRINRLAAEDHVPAPELIARLVEKEEHERLLRAMNDDFGRLREDATRWAAFEGETAAWDTTSTDRGSAPRGNEPA